MLTLLLILIVVRLVTPMNATATTLVNWAMIIVLVMWLVLGGGAADLAHLKPIGH
jgi:hypothetical protein